MCTKAAHKQIEPRHEIFNTGMCDQQRVRPACVYAQSVQSLCLLLKYSMTVKLLTEQHLEFSKPEKEASQARLSLFMSKCHIVGNLMSGLYYI